jgi:hypothetical protein
VTSLAGFFAFFFLLLAAGRFLMLTGLHALLAVVFFGLSDLLSIAAFLAPNVAESFSFLDFSSLMVTMASQHTLTYH